MTDFLEVSSYFCFFMHWIIFHFLNVEVLILWIILCLIVSNISIFEFFAFRITSTTVFFYFSDICFSDCRCCFQIVIYIYILNSSQSNSKITIFIKCCRNSNKNISNMTLQIVCICKKNKKERKRKKKTWHILLR